VACYRVILHSGGAETRRNGIYVSPFFDHLTASERVRETIAALLAEYAATSVSATKLVASNVNDAAVTTFQQCA